VPSATRWWPASSLAGRKSNTRPIRCGRHAARKASRPAWTSNCPQPGLTAIESRTGDPLRK
jgi:hypothetical protein